MKKGFTLIEILAVVTIVGLLFILVMPKITNSLNSKKDDLNTINKNVIINAAKNYVYDNSDTFLKEDKKIYCLPLNTLVKEKYLENIKDVTNDKDITNSKCVKIYFDKSFKYEIVNKSECKANF